MKEAKREIHWGKRAFVLMIYDIVAINLAAFMGVWVRFDFHISQIPQEYWEHFTKYALINTLCTLVIFYLMRMYHSLWIYASVNELWNTAWSCVYATLLQVVGMMLLGWRMPISYYCISFFFLLTFTVASRFFYRLLRFVRQEKTPGKRAQGKNVMIIGAGEAGRDVVNEIIDSHYLDYNVRCFIDDMTSKQGRYISGILVAGGRDKIVDIAREEDIDLILVAIPSMEPKTRKELLEICQQTDCEIRILPGVYQLVKGELSVSRMRKVNITDLLGREQVDVDIEGIMGYVKGKVVLVTGGGGSIGSELCRQIAGHEPKQLIILDIYENNAYDIQQELKRSCPDLNLVVLIGSVRNTNRMNQIFDIYRPDIVYHAAAHKHVPLMEDSPNEAIKNNVFGTYKTAMAASRYGTKKFVLISTDKAVNPTNIMGASKRLCEMIVQMLDRESSTEFVAVRFGNVLGSNGSVIPLFTKQIAEGGPVTVTDKEVVRYFMTIPEAVSLVLQAGAYAKGGEIFVLDMGEPVKIDDLARKMIKLAGYTPDVDMKIEYTGLRPGEKLYEEMLMDEEGLKETPNRLIHIGKPIELDVDVFKKHLSELKSACEKDDRTIKEAVSRVVETYKVDRHDGDHKENKEDKEEKEEMTA
jgi:FlaA1/EpsC-like NDP-sugar epimerase